jgi:hypothetical protein
MVKFNIASRMSWASQRETTRIEDQAYCLMGLFGINMPLLYGEGRRAFHRLQEEIMKMHEDYTLFAWANPWESMAGHCNPVKALTSYQCDGILAESPHDFSEGEWPKPWWPYSELYTSIKTAALQNPEIKHSITGWEFMQLPAVTSQGLSLGLPLRRISSTRYQLCLTCTQSLANIHFLCLTLSISLGPHQQRLPGTLVCTIADAGQLKFIPQTKLESKAFKYTPIYIAHTTSPSAIANMRYYPRGMTQLNEQHWLKVQTDENCSMLESYKLGHDPRNPCSHSPASNEFFLNYPVPRYREPLYIEDLRAVFKIGSQDSSPPFIIGFGTHLMRNGGPWCDVLFQPQAKYGDEVWLKTEGLQYPELENTEGSTKNVGVLDGSINDMKTRSRTFEVPLRETFRDFSDCSKPFSRSPISSGS